MTALGIDTHRHAEQRIAELEAECNMRRNEHLDACRRVDELEAENEQSRKALERYRHNEVAPWKHRAEQAERQLAEARENERLYLQDVHEKLQARYREEDRVKAQLAEARRLLWLRHGCPPSALYGDDGEMQCACGIDFKRKSLDGIERHWLRIGCRHPEGDAMTYAIVGGLLGALVAGFVISRWWHNAIKCPKCHEARWEITPSILRCKNCKYWEERLYG